MDLASLEKDLDSQNLKPVYLFYGQETFLKERFTNRIIGMVDERLFEFNFENLLAEENQVSDILESAQSMPFVTPPRVIAVRGVDRYTAEDLSLLSEYIVDPNESACLVLIADKPDFRLGIFKKLKKMGLAVSFDPPKGRDLVTWVKKSGASRDYKITTNAARVLIELIGTDLTSLDNELEKVCLYAGSKNEIGEKEVRAAARVSQTASIFDLGDALGGQNQARALAALKDLIISDHPLSILAMIVRHFRLLFKTRMLLNEQASQAQAQRALGLPAYVTRKYINQARTLDLVELKKGLIRLQEADLALKSTGIPERLVLEKLILDLASLRPIRRPET
ncbi:MAG: DNA polymerase III subunit delta [Deltaproteobacteria bacterium]|nr:DNA polymerase III subunit delta [Deltaproteobacteria bacterium]MBW2050909.1 DNA polymerase III subunit delta [Deltaproteobacteria bacterium]MBW2139568.1 DNA polymerase III subunit delta [Deltaproteobacteria bacterium]MBW2322597.1 DNA polymerase III subunit delta [Deltaproteobacteria bacterium]